MGSGLSVRGGCTVAGGVSVRTVHWAVVARAMVCRLRGRVAKYSRGSVVVPSAWGATTQVANPPPGARVVPATTGSSSSGVKAAAKA